MKTDQAIKTTYLKDYQVPDFLIDKTYLEFDLVDNATIVTSKLILRRNPASANQQASLKLPVVQNAELA